MGCGSCGHVNEANAKFCSECGAPQELTCGSCDAVQPAGAKFCNQCGTSFGASTTPPDDAPATEPTAVRKNVTALFGDLVGSTSFGEQVDPEATRSVMADYFELLRSTIEDHAGTVVKFMGDGVMAVFGIPEIAEDDALRAVAAATELQQRFRSFADSVRERHGVELGLRVGVNTGELVIGDDDADMVGDVLNTAARLEGACQPGRVLVGEDTWRLTRSSVTYEVLGEIRVKGKAEPIATFQVVTDTDQVSDDVTPFVGRQSELADLQAVFDDACDGGTARLATVIGAPGVGKTRLAAELRAAHEVRSFDLRFERRGSTTFTPIADLLRELTGTGSADDVARLVADHPEASRLADVLAALLGHGETRSTEESFWAVRRLLEMLSADGPLIVVVDDIQWAEPLFWDLLDHLVEWTQAPVFLLALARPELRELKPELAQAGRRVSAAIALEGLDAATTRELAARLLDTDELPGELIDRLPASTDGNPLFVRELVQMLVDDGVLARSGDHWRLTIDVDAIEVPPTILSLLASRVERLPDDERQVVELASVIGTEFDRGSLAALATAETSARLGALIDRLRRKDLIEPSGAWAGDHPVYRFHHVLIRDAAYRRLLKAHRADLHERVGRHLEVAEASDELDVVIAHHYEQVHSYRSDLGTLDDRTLALAAQAARRLQSAAVLALSREDLLASGGYVLRALALTPDGEVRDDLLTLGCEALLSSGDVARGAPVVEELTERSNDPRLEAWADCFRAQLWSLTDSERLVEASQLADGAADRLTSLDDDAGVAKARLVRALILARLGRVGDCEAELDLALGAARAAGDRRRTVAVLGAAPLAALWGPSPVARAGGRCLDVLRLLRITTSSPAVEATSIRCQGMLEALRGRFDSAREKFETSRTTARDLGLRHGLYETELFEGFAELLAGDPVAAEPHLVLARDGLGALGIGADAGQASALLARALLRQGRIDEADVLASAALEAAGENRQTAVASRSVLGEIRVEQGRPDEARQLIAAALEIVERMDITIDHAIAQRSAARVADRLGDANDAQSHRAAAERLLADKGVTGLAEARSERAVADTSDQGTTADDGEAQQTAMVPPNSAWDVNEGLWSTWVAGDRSGYLQLLASDFRARIHELGPKLAFSGDRYATADVLFESLADDRVHAIPNRLIAVRGDDLALIAMTFRDGSSSTTMYSVSQVCDGRALRADTFAEDQLGDALDELDRRWVTLGAPPDVVEGLIQLRQAATDDDYVKLRGLLSDDFEAVDHGQVMLIDRRSVDEFVESIRPQFGDGGVPTSIFTDVPAISDEAALTQFHLDAPDGSGRRLWSLWVWESGRFTRAEIYELDDFEIALARFEELRSIPPAAPPEFSRRTKPGPQTPIDTATQEFTPEAVIDPRSGARLAELVGDTRSEPSLTNAAWEAALSFRDAFNAHNMAAVAACLGDPIRTVNHVPVTQVMEEGDRDGFLTQISQMIEIGGTMTPELIAIRDDDLCLAHLTIEVDETPWERFVVVGVEDGQLTLTVWFDADHLVEALDDLDRQWVEFGGSAVIAEATRAMRNAWAQKDPVILRACLTTDFVAIDHRRLGLVPRSADDWVESLLPVLGGTDVTLPVTRQFAAVDGPVVLARVHVTSSDDGSTWEHWFVGTYFDGRVGRLETFELDDFDAAKARYDELTHAGVAGSLREAMRASSGPQPFDEVVEFLAETLSPGFSFNGRRTSAPHFSDEGAEFYLDTLAAWGAMGATTLTSVPIAVRDDHLFVFRGTIEYADGSEMVFLNVLLSDDENLIQSITTFDTDQLQEALDELDRQWVELGGPAQLIGFTRQMRHANWSGDADLLPTFLLPEWTFHDRRQLGVGQMTREQYLSSSFAKGGGVTVVIPEYIAYTDVSVLTRDRFVAPDGSEWDMLTVGTFDPDGWRSTDLFDPDDLAAARARYEELTRTAKVVPQIPINAATRLIDEYTAALNDGDLDRFLAAFHPEARQELRQRLQVEDVIDIDGITLLGRSVIAGNGVLSFEPVAVFGDHLAVCTQILRFGSDEVRECSVVEIANGLVTRIVRFDDDQLVEALDMFTRRAAELGRPAALADLEITIRGAHWHHDVDAFKQALDPSWAFHDHRRLGLGRMTQEQYLASSFPVVAGEVVHWMVEVLAETESVALTHDRWLTADGSGWDNLHVFGFASGTAQSSDTFDLVDLDAALAAYDRRVAQIAQLASSAGDTAPPFTNRAWETTLEAFAAADAGDRERLDQAFAEDWVGRAHDRQNLTGSLEREQYLDALVDVKTDHGRTPALVATRGDDLCLARGIAARDGFELEKLVINRRENRHGVSSDWYDDTQLHEALDDLDRMWLESGGVSAPILAANNRFRSIFDRGTVDDLRELLSEEFVVVDHRPLGLGTRHRDDWIATVEDFVGDTDVIVARYLSVSDRACLHQASFALRTSGDVLADGFGVMICDASGRLQRMELHGLDQFGQAQARFNELAHAAHARFDELTSKTSTAPAPTFSNRAWEIGQKMIAAHNVGDRQRCASLLADTMAFVAHDPIMQFASPGSELDREAWLDVVFHEDLAGAGHVSSGELIAVRGDMLCLHLVSTTAANGDVSERLYLGEIDETDRCTRIDSYRHDQLSEAYDELDRRFLQALPIEDRETIRTYPPDTRANGPEMFRIDPTSVTPADLGNTASRLGDELAAAYGAGDVNRLREIVSADFSWQPRTHFASALDAPDRDRDSYLEGVLGRIDEQTAPRVGDRQLLAVRGNELYLARSVIRHGDDEIERLAVGRSANGQLVQIIQYDPDQLTEAHLELDRQWVELGGPAVIAEANHRFREVFAGASEYRLEDLITDDFESVDHRPLGLGVRSADEWSQSIAEFVGRTDVVMAAYFAIDGLHTLASGSFVLRDHGEVLVDGLVVNSFTSDARCRRLELFEADQFTAARARFDELVEQTSEGPPAFSNRAWEMQQRCQPLYGRPEFAQFLTPDFESRIHEPFRTDDETQSRQEFIDLMVDFAGWNDEGSSSVELVAIRGDELCLVRNTLRHGPDERISLALVHWTDGLAHSADWYDENQLTEAQIELDRLYLDSLGFAEDHVLRRLSPYAYTTDPTEAASIAHPDLEYGEHRALSFADGGHDEAVVALSTYDLIDHIVVPVFHRLSDNVVLFQKDEFDRDGNVSSFLLLASYLDGLCGTFDVYDLGDLDAALARYDELVAAGYRAPALSNRAWEIVQQIVDSHDRGDRDRLAALISDDVVAQYQDPAFSAAFGGDTHAGKQHYLEVALAPVEWEPGSTGSTELIAVRGDEFCLVRRTRTSPDGDLIERLLVGEVRDDQLVWSMRFPHGSLRDAQIELDRRWFASLGFPPDHPHFPHIPLGYDPTSAGIQQMVSADFSYVEHRRLGFPDGDADQVVANMDSQFAHTEIVIPRYLRISDRAALLERIERTVDRSAEQPALVLIELDDSGKLSHMELFEPDGEAAAIARYDELAAAGAEPGVGNRAWRCVQKYSAALGAGDRERFLDLMTPDFVTVAKYRLNVGQQLDRVEFTDSLFAQRGRGKFREEDELLAVRDDELCLVRTRIFIDEYLMESLIVVRSDSDRLAHHVIFDETQLQEALFELGDQWLDLGGPPEVVNFERAIRAAFLAGSGDPLRPVVTDDFVRVDHRQLSTGDWTIDEFIGSLEPLAEVGGADLVVSEVFDATSRGHVAKADFRAEDATWELLGVHVHEGLKTSRLELFEVAHLEQARTRLRELLHNDSPAPPLANTSTVVAKQFELALEGRDLDRIRGMLHPEYRRTMREKFRTQDTWGIEGEIDFLKGLADVKGVISLDPIAIRGDDLSAFRAVIGAEHTNVQAHAVAVVRDGLILEMVTFDDAQLEETLDELDRQWVELGGSALVADSWARWRRAMYSGDSVAVGEVLAEQFVDVDHRPLGKGTRNRQDYLDALGPLAGVGASVIPTDIVAVDGDAAFALVRMQTDAKLGEWDLWAVTVYSDGLMTLNETFPIDRFEDAQARFDELSHDSDDVRPNRAWVAVTDIAQAWRSHDRAALLQLLAHDFVLISRSSTSTGQRTDRETFADLVVDPASNPDRSDSRQERLAVRGDDLCLFRVTETVDDYTIRMLWMARLGDGKIAELIRYDTEQLNEAIAELDRQWVEMGDQDGEA